MGVSRSSQTLVCNDSIRRNNPKINRQKKYLPRREVGLRIPKIFNHPRWQFHSMNWYPHMEQTQIRICRWLTREFVSHQDSLRTWLHHFQAHGAACPCLLLSGVHASRKNCQALRILRREYSYGVSSDSHNRYTSATGHVIFKAS
jgi:hypothetical protein